METTDPQTTAAADFVCTGMDVPIGPWGAEEVAFWTGTERYQPWKDVAAFFRVKDPAHG